MEENKELVTNVTENTEEQTVEENVEGITLTDTTEAQEQPVVEETEVVKEKKYDDEDLDKILAKKIAIKEAKIRKEYETKYSKYQDTENVLNAGLGTKDIDEATLQLRDYYKEQGINIPEPIKPGLSEREQEILAKAEAEEIIELGISEAEKEANLLANKGYQNLNIKEKAVFNTLASYLTSEKDKAELRKIGVKTEILEDKDFKEFRKDFNPNTNITKVHELYLKAKGETKETPKPIGSMTTQEPNKEKDYYTPEEARKLTIEDYQKNPKLEDIIVKSAKVWQEKGIV